MDFQKKNLIQFKKSDLKPETFKLLNEYYNIAKIDNVIIVNLYSLFNTVDDDDYEYMERAEQYGLDVWDEINEIYETCLVEEADALQIVLGR